MMKTFFTSRQTQLPEISLPVYALMMLVLLFLIYTSFKYYRYSFYGKAFKYLQGFQLLVLYSWYLLSAIPFSNSLPLYHCRLAMFALLLLPDGSKIKQYFALMGVGGAIFALVYPVMDAYTFPHVTAFSFIIGHYALLVNGLVYLFNHYDIERFGRSKIILYTFVLNFLLLIANQLTGGNYGLLRHTPFIAQTALWVRYLMVSLVLIAMLLLIDEIFRRRAARVILLARRKSLR